MADGGWRNRRAVHAVLDFPFDPKVVRGLLKRWLGQGMSERWGLLAGATWWAEAGSIRWAYEGDYVEGQRATVG
jgi:hypothetical protein